MFISHLQVRRLSRATAVSLHVRVMTRFFICTFVLLSPSHSCGPGTRRAHPGHQCLPVRLGGCPAAAGLGPEEEGDGLVQEEGAGPAGHQARRGLAANQTVRGHR